jgi:uncharacterized protein
MDFEFDLEKSKTNQSKHGIDFHRAMLLWEDERRLEISARTTDEPRSMVVGRIGGTCWSAVVTCQGNRIRIISVRRSRREEVSLYEDQGG